MSIFSISFSKMTHFLSVFHLIFFIIFLIITNTIEPCHAYGYGNSTGLPLFIKLIFIFFGVLFLIVFLIIIRRFLAMRNIASTGTVVHYQNHQPRPIFVQQQQQPPPAGFVSTISTGSVGNSQLPVQNVGYVYPNGQMVLTSQVEHQQVYFPAPHQPPVPGFNPLPGAPPPYHQVAPPDHQSYSK